MRTTSASCDEVEVTPAAHDFGTVAMGNRSPDFTFTVTNTNPPPGGAAISALTFSSTGVFAIIAPPPDFVLNTNDCLQRAQGFLGPGASCTVVVYFQVPAGHSGLKQLNWEVSGTSRNQLPAQATAHVQGTGQ